MTVQAEAEGIELGAVVSYVGAILSNFDPESDHTKNERERTYFDACVLLDTWKPGSVYLPVGRPRINLFLG